MQCDILCCYGNTWIDKIISIVSLNAITHIAILDTDTTVIESIWPRTQKMSLEEFNKSRSYFVVRYENLTQEQKDNISKHLVEKLGTKYDLKLAIAVGIKKIFGITIPWDDPNKYICAESVLDAFKEAAGIVLIDKPEVDILPSDFLFNKTSLVIVGMHKA